MVVKMVVSPEIKLEEFVKRLVKKDAKMVVRTLVLKVVREVIRMERNDKVYILNPAYRLRQDGNRAILVSFDDHVNEVDDWFSFIHPLHAQILAFFQFHDHLKMY